MANNNEVQTKAPRKKSRLGNFLSKSASELKKVTWPTFATVLQNLADTGLSALLSLLVG